MRLTCTDHRIIEILGLRPSNRLPVSYYENIYEVLSIILITYLLVLQNNYMYMYINMIVFMEYSNVYIYIYIRLKIKPNSVRIRF